MSGLKPGPISEAKANTEILELRSRMTGKDKSKMRGSFDSTLRVSLGMTAVGEGVPIPGAQMRGTRGTQRFASYQRQPTLSR